MNTTRSLLLFAIIIAGALAQQKNQYFFSSECGAPSEFDYAYSYPNVPYRCFGDNCATQFSYIDGSKFFKSSVCEANLQVSNKTAYMRTYPCNTGYEYYPTNYFPPFTNQFVANSPSEYTEAYFRLGACVPIERAYYNQLTTFDSDAQLFNVYRCKDCSNCTNSEDLLQYPISNLCYKGGFYRYINPTGISTNDKN